MPVPFSFLRKCSPLIYSLKTAKNPLEISTFLGKFPLGKNFKRLQGAVVGCDQIGPLSHDWQSGVIGFRLKNAFFLINKVIWYCLLDHGILAQLLLRRAIV